MNQVVSKDSLNAVAAKYHLNSDIKDKEFDKHFHEYCLSWILEHFSANKRILEMGYGEGNFTEMLLKAGKQVDIIEGAELLAKEANAKFQGSVNVFHSLFSDFQPKVKYDYILATNILEHVENPVEVLKCIASWLTEEGKALITVPNSESLHRRLAVLMGLQPQLDTLSARDHLVGHLRVYNKQTLANDVGAAGLQILETNGFVLKVLPNSMMIGMSDKLVEAFHTISPQVDPTLLANLGIVVSRK